MLFVSKTTFNSLILIINASSAIIFYNFPNYMAIHRPKTCLDFHKVGQPNLNIWYFFLKRIIKLDQQPYSKAKRQHYRQ